MTVREATTTSLFNTFHFCRRQSNRKGGVGTGRRRENRNLYFCCDETTRISPRAGSNRRPWPSTQLAPRLPAMGPSSTCERCRRKRDTLDDLRSANPSAWPNALISRPSRWTLIPRKKSPRLSGRWACRRLQLTGRVKSNGSIR